MPNSDLAAKAHQIFEKTALSCDDVEPEPITEVVAEHLEGAGKLFSAMLEHNQIAEDSVEYFKMVVIACEYFSRSLLTDPLAEFEAVSETIPLHVAAAGHAEEIGMMLLNNDFEEPWQSYYVFMANKLLSYASNLKISPEGTVRYV